MRMEKREGIFNTEDTKKHRGIQRFWMEFENAD
jgi:hypothetical protein